jgi:hypothetical protein
MSKNLSELSGRKGLGKNLFEELGNAAASEGTPSMERLEEIRNEFLVGKSTVYGTVSFYDFLRPENKGKKVYICQLLPHLLKRNKTVSNKNGEEENGMTLAAKGKKQYF